MNYVIIKKLWNKILDRLKKVIMQNREPPIRREQPPKPDEQKRAAVGIVGGAILGGTIGGPPGAMAGLVIGGILAAIVNAQERKRTR